MTGVPGSVGSRSTDAWRKRLEITLFVTPALALIGVFVAWPVISAVRFSLYDWRGYGPLTDFVGLANYATVLRDDVFTAAVVHNLVIVVGSIIVQLPLGIGIALLLNRRIRGRGMLRTLIFVPYVLAEVIAGVIWFQLLQPEYALWTVLAVLTWKYLGLAVILLLAGLQGVPDELYEAAQLDGATWWQTQRQVTLPLLGPTIRTWCFLSMIGSIQLFDMVWILTGGGPADATTTMATYLVNEGTNRSDYGIAGAASVLLFVIAFVMALAYQLIVFRRDVRGAES